MKGRSRPPRHLNAWRRYLLTSASVLAAVCAIGAQAFEHSITEPKVAEAIALAKRPGGVVVADVMTMRATRGDFRLPAGDLLDSYDAKRFQERRAKYPDPFQVFVATPFTRVVATAAEALRRSMPVPSMSVDLLKQRRYSRVGSSGGEFSRRGRD